MKNRIVKMILVLVLLVLVNNTHIVNYWEIPLYRQVGHLYIEIDYGFCWGSNGEGELLNGPEDWGSYICYPDAEQGEAFISIFVYNPFTVWCDDTIIRYDIPVPMNQTARDTFEYDYDNGRGL